MVISSDSKHPSVIIVEEISDHLPGFFITGEVEITKEPIFYKRTLEKLMRQIYQISEIGSSQ